MKLLKKHKLISYKNNSKVVADEIIQLRKELELIGLNSNEINEILERYKDTYSYAFYELRIACYSFIMTMKKSFKKYQKYFKKKM